MSDPTPRRESPLPVRPVEGLTRPLRRFLHVEAAGGVILLVATIAALVAGNSAVADRYRAFFETRVVLGLGSFVLDYPLWYWINDGLMAIFFFVIGLEIKRELVHGELRDRRNVVLPLVAAVGGAAVPVAIYLALQPSSPGSSGWAVPMATDIAFVVGALALLGDRVPPPLKIFMLSLAIIDDMLAVLVIALFFSESIQPAYLAAAAGGFGLVVLLNRIGVRRVAVYAFVGVFIWVCTLKSGLHPTVAGALLGLLTPASAWIGDATLLQAVDGALARLRGGADGGASRREAAEDLAFAATESVSPLARLEAALHPWVGFAIMPVFALANASVAVSADGFTEGIAVAVMAGLVLGKPIGIAGAALLACRLGLARLPEGTSPGPLLGAACLGGIGFTMALFIASLSLAGESLDAAKAGILAGSAASLVLGMSILFVSLRRRER